MANGSETVAKQGLMMLLCNAQSGAWEKRHVVLRRPYLEIHPSAGERETGVINLAGASVSPSPDVDMLLEVGVVL